MSTAVSRRVRKPGPQSDRLIEYMDAFVNDISAAATNPPPTAGGTVGCGQTTLFPVVTMHKPTGGSVDTTNPTSTAAVKRVQTTLCAFIKKTNRSQLDTDHNTI